MKFLIVLYNCLHIQVNPLLINSTDRSLSRGADWPTDDCLQYLIN
jgi:hypothetical protein